MTPFGKVLSQLRRSRKLQQKQLAEAIGIEASYVSALEGGKKSPPSRLVLSKLIDFLNLSDEELQALESSIGPSERVIRLPNSVSLEEYDFLWELRKRLGSLSREELMIMTSALKLGSTNFKKEKIE
tara:strand:- start:1309 stop:1689 length:381 start_codon:yes stop_codon:yes gene_type:complete